MHLLTAALERPMATNLAGGAAMDPSTPSRHEKSLGLLTTKFVNLLQEAKDGVLDLKVVRGISF